MISFEVYKFFHLIALITVVMCLSANTFVSKPMKWARLLGMGASLLLMVAGMGLLARGGIGHGGSWPIWVKLKMAIWLMLAIGAPVCFKRLPTHRTKILSGALLLLTTAIGLVISRFGE